MFRVISEPNIDYKESIRFVNPVAKPFVAPYLNNVVLHLKGENLLDSSPSPKPINTFGGIAVSSAQSKYGGSSIYFDGNTDYLSIATNTDFNFGTGNFTIEFWARFSVLGILQILLDMRPTGTSGAYLTLAINDSSKFGLYANNGYLIQSSINVSANTWTHLAISRNGNTFTMFVNGINAGQTTNSISFIQEGISIGVSRQHNNSQYYITQGYLDSLRITKGIAIYTSNFDPELDTYLAY